MKNKAIIILSIILLFLMITTVSASETNTTDTVNTNDNFEVSASENNTGEVDVTTLPITNSENVNNNDRINVEELNETSSRRDEFNVSDENIISNIELESSNNIIDNSVKNKEKILSATSNILTNNNDNTNTISYDSLKSNEDIILSSSSNELLSEEYPTKTYTILDPASNYLKIEVCLKEEEYYWSIIGFKNQWDYLIIISSDDDKNYIMNMDDPLTTVSSGSFSKTQFKSKVYFSSRCHSYGTFYSSESDYLPLPEVDTSVSVTNPSVKYNSGNFGVSGTETGMMIC